MFPKLPSRTSSLPLKNAKKHIANDGSILTTVKSAEDTLSEIIQPCKRIGVTRISDITHLDKLRIPNYSAVLPGTEDSIWVYSGKGSTRAHARASALMEAIERHSSLSSTNPKCFIQGTFLELSKSYNKVLHPDEVVEPVNQSFNDKDSIMDFLPGYDMLAKEEILVPAQLALSKYIANPHSVHVFSYTHTNGLASGNVMEEAICHALCEVIERDASSIADLCASSMPHNILVKLTNSLESNCGYQIARFSAEDKFVDDPSIFPDVDISEISNDFGPLRSLVKRYAKAVIPLLVKDITQKDIGIATFVASSIEWISHDYGYFAKGHGTHPDARIALIRAITEVSQTRAANIQGARDDLNKVRYRENDEIYKRKWQFMPASLSPFHQESVKNVEFSKIKTYTNKYILDDIRLILNSLKQAGLKRAIIVDLTNPSIGIPVVRAIVPGLETFEVAKYTDGESFIGKRAKKRFREEFNC